MLVNLSGISKSFGPDDILIDINGKIDPRDKIALVGRNGAGKTTLIKILTADHKPDKGNVHWGQGVRVGYLGQHSLLNDTFTIIEEAQEACKHLFELKARLEELEKKLEIESTPDDLDEYSMIQEHFISQDGYSTEHKLQTALSKMGFEKDTYHKPVKGLSGGERTRLTLAKLILEEPDLLILDEPTNHLDIEGTEWLENWLRNYCGAVLMVSHDRVFLQNVANRIWELRNKTIKPYPGPFDKYLEIRRLEDEFAAETAKRQSEEIGKLDEYVRRFINSQRTAQARGRQKKMEKLKEQLVDAPKDDKVMKAAFNPTKRSGDIVIESKKLSKDFGEQKIFKDLDWLVQWSERWGIIGVNGAGKSTLMKVVLGHLPVSSGTVKVGGSVELGYFSQDAFDLDLELSPLQVLSYDLGMEAGEARSLLGKFLISGDDVFRPIKTLSGGERNKLVLAKLTALNPNLLVLDEPTNHLDMASAEALVKVLKDYEGTLIVISHDRWLLENVVDHVMDIRKHKIVQFEGTFQEYRNAMRGKKLPDPQSTTKLEKEVIETTVSPHELSKAISKQTKKIDQSEQIVTQAERELKAHEELMASADPNQDFNTLSKKYVELKKFLEEAILLWEKDSEELDMLRGQQQR